MFLTVGDATPQVETSGTSSYCLEIQTIAMRIIRAFESLSIKVGFLSTYVKEVQMMRENIAFASATRFAFAATIDEIQGSESDVVVLSFPKNFTDFSVNSQRLIVSLTRHKLGLVIIAPDTAIQYQTYRKRSFTELASDGIFGQSPRYGKFVSI